MNFSLDTNIIIGVVNTKDRLHEISINLMREKQNDRLFLCSSVLKESTTVLRTNISNVFGEIFQLIPDLSKTSELTLIDLHKLLIDIFKQIKDKKPELNNFLNLVYEEIIGFLKNNSIDKLPLLFSQLSIKYSRNAIDKEIKEIHSFYDIINLESENLSGVKKGLVDVHFKDNMDDQIFKELMTNLFEVKPITFFSNDKEFADKCKKGYAEIAKIFMFEDGAFSFFLV